ncbi:hypothetical protein E0H32_33880, partial [Rhizobium leguminosarum bv. viciae]
MDAAVRIHLRYVHDDPAAGRKALSFPPSTLQTSAIQNPGSPSGVLLVRPAWAHSCGCKSHRKLAIASEEKRNC